MSFARVLSSVDRRDLDFRSSERRALTVQLVLDAVMSAGAVAFGAHVAWDIQEVSRSGGVWIALIILCAALVGGKVWVRRRSVGSAKDSLWRMLVWIITVFGVFWFYLRRIRWEYPYPVSFFVVSILVLLLWQLIEIGLLPLVRRRPALAIVPGRGSDGLTGLAEIELCKLEQPRLDSPVSALVVDMHQPLSPEWGRFVAECAASGLPIYHVAAVYEAATNRVPLAYLSDTLMHVLINRSRAYLPVKRVLDVACVLLSLPVTLPISLVTAVAIRLDSPGPVLFWQERVGQGGRIFRLVKFRSMYTDAESRGARFAEPGDSRVTRVGRVIRKLRIDELPQLWNVLRGDMSLIGPRPEQVPFVREFEQKIPFYTWRHSVRPGITGWAQVHQGYAAGVQDTIEKLEYDLYYIKHISLWLDISIILRTLRVILTGDGAR